jgi:hypothetical protein
MHANICIFRHFEGVMKALSVKPASASVRIGPRKTSITATEQLINGVEKQCHNGFARNAANPRQALEPAP